MRAACLLLLLTTVAIAKPRNAEQAIAANQTAYQRALARLKLSKIRLETAPVPATPDPKTVVVPSFTFQDPPEFVVDATKTVFLVVHAPKKTGRFTRTVCNAGPVRQTSLAFAIPDGHTYKGEVRVTYPGYEIVPQNTCR